MQIAIVGLGKLGSVMAAVAAAKGHHVQGVDLNPDYVRAINEGRAPVDEPGLDALIRSSHDHLSATVDCEAAVEASAITFIVVPTPSDSDGMFSLRYVLPAIESIGHALRRKRDYHLVVLSSTVIPGSMSRTVLPLLEKDARNIDEIGQLLADRLGELHTLRHRERGLHLRLLHREVGGRFIQQERRDLGDERTEVAQVRPFVAEARHLLPHERVLGDVELRDVQRTAAPALAAGVDRSSHSRAAVRRRSRSISGYTG